MNKSYKFTVHDESVNTYGFRMLTDGANLTEFEKNPVILYNHNDWETPIGRADKVYKENGTIVAEIVFDTADPKAAEIAGKVERGFLRMASVGAWPPEEATDDELMKLDGQSGPTITRWTLREISICPIGANHNALAMYDRTTGKRIDLSDRDTVIRLADNINDVNLNPKKENNMSVITQLLRLSDSASEQAIAEELRKLIALRDQYQSEIAGLKTEKKNLQLKLDTYEQKERETRKAQAVALVDAAVKDGRIDASGRDAWVKDLENDFENASVRLSSITRRQAVATQVIPEGKSGAITLRDMTFQDILKADRLKELKQDKELYRQKFREAYGHEPA